MQENSGPPEEPQAGPADTAHQKGSVPIFNLPGGILLSLAVLSVIYALQALVFSEDTNAWIAFEFGFSPLRYVYPLADQTLAWIWTPVTYSLLHGSFEHLAFNGLWLAAFGTPVYRRIGAVRFAIFWLISSMAGAGLHAVVNWGSPSLMVGASGVISALMGAACRFAFGGRQRGYLQAFGIEPPLLSVPAALADRTVRVFIIVWFLGNVAVAFGLPLFGDYAGMIAWDAHIGGFLFDSSASAPSIPTADRCEIAKNI